MSGHEIGNQPAVSLVSDRLKSYSLGLVSVGYFWLLIEGGGAKYVSSLVGGLPEIVSAIVDPYILAALFVFGIDLIYRGVLGRSWFKKYGDGLAGVWSGGWRIFVIVTGIMIFFVAIHLIAK